MHRVRNGHSETTHHKNGTPNTMRRGAPPPPPVNTAHAGNNTIRGEDIVRNLNLQADAHAAPPVQKEQPVKADRNQLNFSSPAWKEDVQRMMAEGNLSFDQHVQALQQMVSAGELDKSCTFCIELAEKGAEKLPDHLLTANPDQPPPSVEGPSAAAVRDFLDACVSGRGKNLPGYFLRRVLLAVRAPFDYLFGLAELLHPS